MYGGNTVLVSTPKYCNVIDDVVSNSKLSANFIACPLFSIDPLVTASTKEVTSMSKSRLDFKSKDLEAS